MSSPSHTDLGTTYHHLPPLLEHMSLSTRCPHLKQGIALTFDGVVVMEVGNLPFYSMYGI